MNDFFEKKVTQCRNEPRGRSFDLPSTFAIKDGQAHDSNTRAPDPRPGQVVNELRLSFRNVYREPASSSGL